jgi:hypothetical protein
VRYLKDFRDLRTPHNIFYYALGYSGWLGVLLFFSLQVACGALVSRVYKNHWPVLWRCDLGIYPVYCILRQRLRNAGGRNSVLSDAGVDYRTHAFDGRVTNAPDVS